MRARSGVILGVVFVFVAHAAAAPADAPTLAGEIGRMLEVGERISPKSAASAHQLYEKLRSAHPNDAQVQYAYALVLIRQRKLDEAGKLLTQVVQAEPEWLAAWRAKVWVDVAGRKFTLAFDDMRKAASAVGGAIRPDKAAMRDECQESARFLGRAYGYLDSVQKNALSLDQLRRVKQQVLSRLGEASGAFEEGEESIATDLRHFEADLDTARRTAEAVASEKQQQIEAKKKDVGKAEAHVDFQAEKVKTDAQAQAEALEKQAVEIRGNIVRLQLQLGRVQGAVTAQQNQMALQTVVGRTDANSQTQFALMQNYLNELLRSQAQLAAAVQEQNIRLARLAAAREALVSGTADASAELQNRSAELKRQESRLGRAQKSVTAARSSSLEQQKRSFSSYEPFRYELERQSLLEYIK